MVGKIQHATQFVAGDPKLNAAKWNETHYYTPFLISEILSDHNKTVHDALGIIAAAHAASHLASGSDTIANATPSTSGFMGSLDKSKLDAVEALADVTDAGNVGSSVWGASAKTTPVDADTFAINDTAASNVLKKLTWANTKATLLTYFDTIFAQKTAGGTITFGSGKDFETLQGAIDSIKSTIIGDVLLLGDAGTYSEDLRMGGWTSQGSHKITIRAATETTDLIDTMTGGTAGNQTAKATVIKSTAGYTVDAYRGKWIEFTSDANSGEVRPIKTNDATTFILAGPLLPAAPANGDTFKIISNDVTIDSADMVINPVGVELCFENVNFGDVVINNAPLVRFVRTKRVLSGVNNNKLTGSTIWERNTIIETGNGVIGVWNYGSRITMDGVLLYNTGSTFEWGVLSQGGGHTLVRNGSVVAGFTYAGVWADIGGTSQLDQTDSYGIEANTFCFVEDNTTGILAVSGGDVAETNVVYSGNTTDKTPAAAADSAWIG